MGSAFLMRGDRLLAIAFVLMVTVALAGITARETGASFTGTSTNPTSQANVLRGDGLFRPEASQTATPTRDDIRPRVARDSAVGPIAR